MTTENIFEGFDSYLPAVRTTAPMAAPRVESPAARALIAHNIDFRVALEPLRTLNGRDVPMRRAVVRQDTGAVIQTVGNDYALLQNEEAFGVLDVAARDGMMAFAKAGSRDGGAKVWMRADLSRGTADVAKGDAVSASLLVSNGHGDGAFDGSLTITRLACLNGLTLEDARVKLFSVRHVGQITDKLAWVKEQVDKALEQFAVRVEAMKGLARRRMQTEDIRAYLAAVVPDPVDPEAKAARAKREKVRDEIVAYLETASDLQTEGVQGTLWGAYNAVTGFVDHVRYGKLPEERQFLTTTWGAGAELKSLALREALARV
jgi:phage/plasmid-like protein (TIGR03299 family)